MPYHVGFLYLSDAYGNPTEVVNEARTLAALEEAGCSLFGNVYDGDRLIGLRYEPCAMASDGSVTSWAALDTSGTAAPWYDGTEQSLEAYGFVIDEWTGLDGSVHRRPSRPRGPRRGGSSFGLQYHAERVMSINLVLLGSSERGLNHLFRWLETTLLASCSPCETNTVWLREFYPTGFSPTELEEGLAHLDEVVLVDGPTWTSERVQDAGTNIRVCSLTLTAGDPCFRRVPGDSTTETGTPTPASADSSPPGCADYSGADGTLGLTLAAPGYGAATPLVKFQFSNVAGAGAGYATPPYRIMGFIDDGSGESRPCQQRRRGFIALDGVPPGSEVIVDCGSITAQARNVAQGVDWYDATKYLVPRVVDFGGAMREPVTTAGCQSLHVVIEPATQDLSSPQYPGSILISEVTITAWPVVRFGCS